MSYIAVIDREHLDNAMFLTTLSESLSRQEYQDERTILIHGDSDYTDRIIQTGVMREEAVKRSIKGLNKRLIALFADDGVSTIGINGYQRGLVTREEHNYELNEKYLNSIHEEPVWLISSLIKNKDRNTLVPMSLPKLARLLQQTFKDMKIILFCRARNGELFQKSNKPESLKWNQLDQHFKETYIPAEFHDIDFPVNLTTAYHFRYPTDEDSLISIY